MRTRALIPAMLAIVASACSSSDDGATVDFGAILDQSSLSSETGWSQALDLAVADVNAAQSSVKFGIRSRDSGGSVQNLAQDANALVTDQVFAVVTDTSEAAATLTSYAYDADAANDLSVPIQCSNCFDDNFNDPGAVAADALAQATARDLQGWRWRTVDALIPLTNVACTSLSRLGADTNHDGYVKLSIYTGDDAFGAMAFADLQASATTVFSTFADSAHLTIEHIAHRSDIDPNTVDYVRDLGRLLDSATENPNGTKSIDRVPDYVIVADHAASEAGVVEAYDATESSIPLFHLLDFRHTSVLYNLDALAEGQRGVSPLVADGAPGAAFSDGFAKAYGYDPPVLAAAFYDNAVTLMLAYVSASAAAADGVVDGVAVRNALSDVSAGTTEVDGTPAGLKAAAELLTSGSSVHYVGASGPLDRDARRSVRDRVAEFTVSGSAFTDNIVTDCTVDGACGR